MVNGSRNVDDWEKVPDVPLTWNHDAVLNDWDAAECDVHAGGYRLATEAEWLCAAKGGTDCCYAGSRKLDEIAWYKKNSAERTHVVMLKEA